MNFRTELIVPKARRTLNIGESVLTLGSCFAQSMGQRFLEAKFRALINPFGTTYHPAAIHRHLEYAASKKYPAPSSYLMRQEIALNYDMHSSLSASDTSGLKSKIEAQIDSTHKHLKECQTVMLTYGTAWIFHREDTGESVANCHRMPSSQFRRRLASVEEIQASFEQARKLIVSINPSIHFILTVSPVRHVKDTLEMNSLSKAILRLACHRLTEAYADIDYFPSYEILMDDLRDYRFYKEDLIHPTTMANDYIWEKFSAAYFSEELILFLQQWQPIRQAINHRPFHQDSEAHQAFIRKTLHQLDGFSKIIPVDTEIQSLKAQIINQQKSS